MSSVMVRVGWRPGLLSLFEYHTGWHAMKILYTYTVAAHM